MNLTHSKADVHFVVGLSMWPTLKPGDELYFSRIGKIRAGDIIGYQFQNIGIIHRVINIKGEYIYTKGDNCPEPDGLPVRAVDIKGRLITIKREGVCIKIKNGRLGAIVSQKCSLQRTLKNILLAMCRLFFKNKRLRKILKNNIYLSHDAFTLFKKSDTLVSIYHLGCFCGYYCFKEQQFTLRYRYDMQVSDLQRVRMRETIERMFIVGANQ